MNILHLRTGKEHLLNIKGYVVVDRYRDAVKAENLSLVIAQYSEYLFVLVFADMAL